MKLMRLCTLSLMIVSLAAGAQSTGAPAADLDSLFSVLKAYQFGESRQALSDLNEVIRTLGDDAAKRQDIAARLGQVVSGESTLEAKRFAARQLSVIGTAAEVPALAELMKSPETNDIGVKALTTMPLPEAGAALR